MKDVDCSKLKQCDCCEDFYYEASGSKCRRCSLLDEINEIKPQLAIEREAKLKAEASVKKLQKAIEAIGSSVGPWLSAAFEDPAVCPEMKADIEIFFQTLFDLGNKE